MTMTKHKPWTAADDAELVLMREARTPTKEIAIALGRTPSAVMNRISAKGIPYGKELTFSEVVDQAFAKHEIEFGVPDRKSRDLERSKPKTNAYGFGRLPEMLEQMERDIKRKPEWFKAMMWWRK
jgi:hypothetical protein